VTIPGRARDNDQGPSPARRSTMNATIIGVSHLLNRTVNSDADVRRVGPGPVAIPVDDSLVALRSPGGVALIATTALASGTAFFDANVVKVAVPAISRAFDASVGAVQWTLTGYLLAVAALLLLSGGLADHFGKRRLLTFGLLVTLVASVLCGLAPSIGTLIAARALQGVGGAFIVPASLALLNGTLRVSDRARGIGLWAGLGTLMSTVVPYFGGWLIDTASWRAVFFVNIPLVLAALIVLQRVPQTAEKRRPLSADVPGAVLAVIGLGGLVYALTAGSTSGWTSHQVLITGIVGAIALFVLVPAERRARAPMLRVALFASRQFDAINVTTLLLYGAFGAASYLLILQCELQLGYSASQAGAALIPQSVVFLALAPISGALVSRFGTRWMMTSGIVIVSVALSWLSRVHPGASYATTILPAAVLWGVGIGITVTPLTAGVLAAVGDADLGEGSAINTTAARVGALFTIAVVPALLGVSSGRSLTHALDDGYEPAMLALAGLCLLAALVAALFVADDRATARGLPPVLPVETCSPCAQDNRSLDP